MNKNKKGAIFLTIMSIMCILMLVLYANFLSDEKAAQAKQQQVLSPDQMVNGIKKFVNDTTSNITPIPVKP